MCYIYKASKYLLSIKDYNHSRSSLLWITDCCCCSVAKSCLTLCNSMNCNMPGFLSFNTFGSLLKLMSIESMMPSISSLSPASLPALNLSQHQGLFQWVSSLHQVAKILELQHQLFQWIFRVDFHSDRLVWPPCSSKDSGFKVRYAINISVHRSWVDYTLNVGAFVNPARILVVFNVCLSSWFQSFQISLLPTFLFPYFLWIFLRTPLYLKGSSLCLSFFRCNLMFNMQVLWVWQEGKGQCFSGSEFSLTWLSQIFLTFLFFLP